MVTAFAALLAAALSALSIKYTGDNLDLLRQQQNASRFASAVQQLGTFGAANAGVRLGAVYALQSLMKDAPDYQPVVVDVLSAHIRGQAARPAKLPANVAEDADNDPPSPIEVKAAVTVVAAPRPAGAPELDFNNTLLGLEGITLAGADLHKAYLVHADLRGVNLAGADLTGAQLDETSLGGANMEGAKLGGADLGGAYLGFANLKGAFLTGATTS